MKPKHNFQATAQRIIAERVLDDAKAELAVASKGTDGVAFDRAYQRLKQAKSELKEVEKRCVT